jgi:hypothetical protein
MTDTLDDLIGKAAERGLSEIVLRESVGGWQAITKFHGALMGPWDVGCDPDPAQALRLALEPKKPAMIDEDVFG